MAGEGTSLRRQGMLLAGRFEIVSRLAKGDSTEVYLARDLQSGADVVLKFLRPEIGPRTLPALRFQHEATLLETLSHPNIVRLAVPLSVEGDCQFFGMEHVARGSLADVLHDGVEDRAGLVLTVSLDVLDALDHVHGEGLVHRDVKPQNVLVSEGTAGKLADFGIAHDSLNDFTRLGDTLGSLIWMAPEQRIDPKSATGAADLYGLGASIYGLLTERTPMDLVDDKKRREGLAALPRPLRDVVDGATRPKPADRFPDARAMRAAVEVALGEVVGRDGTRARRVALPLHG